MFDLTLIKKYLFTELVLFTLYTHDSFLTSNYAHIVKFTDFFCFKH